MKKPFAILRAVLPLAACAFSTAAPGRDPAAPSASDAPVPLPPYTVSETLKGEFYVKSDHASKRVWLISARENQNVHPALPKFIGAGLKSGDEIVRVAGRPVAEMELNETIHALYKTISRVRNRTIDIAVRSPGAKEIRQVTLRFVPAPPGTKPPGSAADQL